MKNKSSNDLLKKYIKEHFSPFSDFVKIGFFSKEMKGDYDAMAKRICDFFGYKTVYEYSSKEIRCHITYCNPDDKIGLDASFRPLHINEQGELKCSPFVEVIPSDYD